VEIPLSPNVVLHTFTYSDILNNQQQNEQDQKITIQTIIVGPCIYIHTHIYFGA